MYAGEAMVIIVGGDFENCLILKTKRVRKRFLDGKVMFQSFVLTLTRRLLETNGVASSSLFSGSDDDDDDDDDTMLIRLNRVADGNAGFPSSSNINYKKEDKI